MNTLFVHVCTPQLDSRRVLVLLGTKNESEDTVCRTIVATPKACEGFFATKKDDLSQSPNPNCLITTMLLLL